VGLMNGLAKARLLKASILNLKSVELRYHAQHGFQILKDTSKLLFSSVIYGFEVRTEDDIKMRRTSNP
jgi:hypothetical protein